MDLKVESTLTLNVETLASPNLCSSFSDNDLKAIGTWVWDGWNRDEGSRRKWLKRTSAAMDLALQIQNDKNFPWPNCSNIAFPLITIAVMQFHARAYPALVTAPDLVKARVIGEDPDGKLKERASRISTHMSWQCLEQDQPWEEQEDRLILNIAVVGCTFKKSFYSNKKGHNVSEMVLAKDLVIDYWAKTVEDCPRKTHVRRLYRNDLHEEIMRKSFRDVREESWYDQPPADDRSKETIDADNRAGLEPPQADDTTPFETLEQHVSVDLDKDGYAEPYIITIEKSSKSVLRIVTRVDRESDIDRDAEGDIICVRAMEYFTKKGFIPSPDGGIYDVGFGVLLGPLNESANSLVNQLVDTGTMQNTAGGFLGRGAKIRGGNYTFAPFQWNRVDSSGDDLQKSIFPLPVRDPSQVLFTLLSFIVNYTNRISGSTDMMVGENPGQNTPAQTSQEMVQQGEKIFSAIFKRIWRATKEEFKKLYTLNAIFLPDKVHFGENGAFALKSDYLGDPSTVVPVADPNIKSETTIIKLAMTVAERAGMVPGYDTDAVELNLLSAMKVSSPQSLFPGTKGKPPAPSEKLQIEKMKQDGKLMALHAREREHLIKLMEQKDLIEAQIVELHARAELEAAQAAGQSDNHALALVDAMIGAAKLQSDHLNGMIKHLVDGMKLDSQERIAENAQNQPE